MVATKLALDQNVKTTLQMVYPRLYMMDRKEDGYVKIRTWGRKQKDNY